MTLFVVINIAIVIIAAAMAIAVVVAEARNAKRTRCRACNTRIDPGGVGVPYVGCGFCQECRVAILKEVK